MSIESVFEIISGLQLEHKQVTAQLKEAQLQEQSLMAKLNNDTTTLSAIQLSNDKSQKACATLMEEIIELRANLETLNSINVQRDFMELEKQSALQFNEFQTIRGTLQNLISEINQNRAKWIEKNVEDEQQKVMALEDDITRSSQLLAVKKQEVEKLQRELDTINQQCDQLRFENMQQKQKCAEIQKTITSKETFLRCTSPSSELSLQEQEQYNKQLAQLDNDIAAAEEDYIMLQGLLKFYQSKKK